MKAKKKKKEIDKEKYIEPDGTFKVMDPPAGIDAKPSKFWGCVRYQIANGKSLEAAKKICGYIKHYVKEE